MGQYVYLDVLDTARTPWGGAPEQIKRSCENRFRGQAELKMSLVCGWTPVFPQTYGWDSSALLDYGAEASFVGKSFIWLLQQGFIRIRLRNQPSIWAAALDAFKSPAYRHLSAWPEFNTDSPQEARRPLVETMQNWQPRLSRTRKFSEALSEEVCNRLDLLDELSRAVEQAPREEPELPREDRLSSLIKVAAGAAAELDPGVANLLSRCTTDVSDPNNRTAIDIFLDQESEKIGDLIPDVREITNGCFNAVAAACVRARPALTLPCSMPLAFEVLRKSLPGSVQSDVWESAIGEVEVSELEVVGWDKIEEFLTKCRNLPVNERTKEAEAAKLVAKEVVEKDNRYVMKTERKNFLYNSAVWGGAGLVGAVGGFVVAGAPGAVAGAVVLATAVNGLAGGLGGRDIRRAEKDKLAARLEKKYLGLIEIGKDSVQSA